VTNTPRVLVVDGISETETVLKAVFEPQGTQVERRRSSDAADRNRTPPRVVVVDLDDQSACVAKSDWPHVPRVFLSSTPQATEQGRARFLEKPFHYPELIRLVQSLLELPTERRRVG
jgi:CheY-like chemotaxis protein